MKGKKGMDGEIKVSVICWVYNHEKFLERCLDGFVNQKTDFKYEVLIHDDASTDNSKQIIEKYYSNYPDIIVPIYEEKNQFLNHDKVEENIRKMAKGKYHAYCEGDDYWSDENKLQRQFDYMEKNQECSICTHNTVIRDLCNKEKDTLFNNWKDIHEMTEEEVFIDWKVHFSSFFIRKEADIKPEFAKKYWFGDFIKLTMAYNFGKVMVLPDIMSVYNNNNIKGITKQIYKSSIEKKIEKIEKRIKYLKDYNEFTNKKYNDIILKSISEIELEIKLEKLEYIEKRKEYYELRKSILKDEYYKEYLNKCVPKKKTKIKLITLNYLMLRLIERNKKRSKNVWMK